MHGFAYALNVAEKFIRSGSHKRALVVGAEVFSRILDWNDRGTCVLFGDGAGAVVLEASDKPGILATALHADGSHNGILCVPGRSIAAGDHWRSLPAHGRPGGVQVRGQGAERRGPEVLDQAGLTIDDIDWLIPIRPTSASCRPPPSGSACRWRRSVATVDEHGNTSAASIPLALDEAVRDGRIQRGQNDPGRGRRRRLHLGRCALEFLSFVISHFGMG